MSRPLRITPPAVLVALAALGLVGCFDFARFYEVPADGATLDGAMVDGSLSDSGTMCGSDFADCDSEMPGCETPVSLDRTHCGQCDNACETLEGCFRGSCAEVDLAWRVTGSGTGNEFATAVAPDDSGGLWLAGMFDGTMTFGGAAIAREAPGSGTDFTDGFIVRVRQSNGTPFTNIERIASAAGSTNVAGVLPQPGGAAAWVGVNANVEPNVPSTSWRMCQGAACGWVRLLHVDGGFWGSSTAKVVLSGVEGTAVVEIDAITDLGSGAVLVGGRVSNGASALTFRAQGHDASDVMIGAPGPRNFLVRISSEGVVLGATLFEVTDGALFRKLVVLPGGDIVAGGLVHHGSLTVEGAAEPTILADNMERQFTLARIDPVSGGMRWLEVFTCGEAQQNNDLTGLARDPAGNVYALAHCYGGSFALGGDELGTSRPGTTSLFAGSFTADGTHRWSRAIGNALIGTQSGALSIVDGLMLMTATTNGTVAEIDLGAGPLVATGLFDGVLAALDPSTGSLVWGRLLNASGAGFSAVALPAMAARGRAVFVAGMFAGTFDGETAEDQADMLAARFDLP